MFQRFTNGWRVDVPCRLSMLSWRVEEGKERKGEEKTGQMGSESAAGGRIQDQKANDLRTGVFLERWKLGGGIMGMRDNAGVWVGSRAKVEGSGW